MSSARAERGMQKSAFITVLRSAFNHKGRSPLRSNTEIVQTAYGRTLGEPWLAMT